MAISPSDLLLEPVNVCRVGSGYYIISSPDKAWVPYPFGIYDAAGGEECSINGVGYGYGITCNTSYDPPKPFLGTGNIEILSISDSEIRVRSNQVATACFTESGVLIGSEPPGRAKNIIAYSLNGTSFTFSYTKNRLFSIGCDTANSFLGISVDRNNSEHQYSSLCSSQCDSSEAIIEGSCAGSGCFQLTIPKGTNLFGARVFSYDNHTKIWSFDHCGYTLMAEQDQYTFRASVLLLPSTDFIAKGKYMPIVIDWEIGNRTCEEAETDLGTFACQNNSKCINSDNNHGYRCTCYDGYEGNPYLSPGCQDIDECEDPNNNCEGICTNTEGSYICSCPIGSPGDGRKDGRGCVMKQAVPILKLTLGIGLGLLFLLVGASWLYLTIRKRKQMQLKVRFFEKNGGLLLKQNIPTDEGGVESTRIYTAQELGLATNNYDKSRVLGEGGYGTVYKGILSDNREVAIKKSKIVDQSQIQQFINEVIILTQINHRNVVKLLVCCLETKVPLLVYEYVSNGTLFQDIHYNKSEASSISWHNRLRIATETASAIAYLHSAASTPIIHRDIKSANILLDENYTAKVSDFGASRLIPLDQNEIVTLVQGTLGYLDPDYFKTSQLTEKSDVYSFGVVLIELLTGEKPVSFERSEEQRNLASFFVSKMEDENALFQLLDAQVFNEENREQILDVVELAKRCVALKSEVRPTMKQVVAELDKIASHKGHTRLVPSEPTDLCSVPMIYSTVFDSGQYSPDNSSTITKPGCQSTCGDVSIPYPFGMISSSSDSECSIDSALGSYGFTINCNATYDPPKPFLLSGAGFAQQFFVLMSGAIEFDLEILSISESEIRLKTWQTTTCYSKSGVLVTYSRDYVYVNFSGSPFTFSETKNRVFAVGCHTSAFAITADHVKNYTRRCVPKCDSRENVLDQEGSCTGSGCCKIELPKGQTSFIGLATSPHNHTEVWSFNPCSSIFMAEQDLYNLQGNKDVPIPVVLNWAIGKKTCEEAQKDLAAFACHQDYNSSCINSDNGLGYLCSCNKGYEGNPYFSPGCQDVNECEDPTNNPCEGICTNIVGSFSCACPKGSSGDGRKDGSGCTLKNREFSIIKVVIGIGVAFVSLVIASSWLFMAIKERKLTKLKEKFFQQNGGLQLQLQIGSHENGMELMQIFTAKQLEKATNNYNKNLILGQGGFGTIYKGILFDNPVVAIKKSKIVDQSQIEQFINEVVILTQIHHRNVVKLLGCCLETEAPLLVYEYVSNGTLFHHIHHKVGGVSSISWESRLRIAAETASALGYLHSSPSIPVIHRDMKSTNILLDENYTVKVSDFGASMLVPLDRTQITTLVQGTIGYLDPEYFHTGQLTEKSDVYSFGVVLVELLTGEKPLNLERSEEQRNFTTYFISLLGDRRLFELLDARVSKEGRQDQIVIIAKLAEKCLNIEGKERPKKVEVAVELEGLIRTLETQTPGSTDYRKPSHDKEKSDVLETVDLYPVPLIVDQYMETDMTMSRNIRP
ncbi:hypothetical protein C5167_009859 [Papaver somniferum]|uniref:Protein kinase domain-containing protein n=1 Tax=Papaver somniferum TaxID=3469 RepID=A0A4Y7K1H6_PAPSO|nr:hypothetical protein C5167_009859 [Papaver somniferum]